MTDQISDFFRFIHVDPEHNTMADCLAETFAMLIEHVCEQEIDDYPCECGADSYVPEREHSEECAALDRPHEAAALSAQLGELHRLAKLGERPKAKADPALWADGPDSEAARAYRGEGTQPARRSEVALRGMDADIGHLEDDNARLNTELETLRCILGEAIGRVPDNSYGNGLVIAEGRKALARVRGARAREGDDS